MMTPLTEVEMEALMVAVVDGVASPTQRERLSTYLRDHPELARELEDHMALKALTDGWVSRLEVDLIETRHQEQPLTRREAGIAGVLLTTLNISQGQTIFSTTRAPSEGRTPVFIWQVEPEGT